MVSLIVEEANGEGGFTELATVNSLAEAQAYPSLNPKFLHTCRHGDGVNGGDLPCRREAL